MAELSVITEHLNNLLEPKRFDDSAFNGLQVESSQKTVRTIAFAVDAGMRVVERALTENAELLIVHHGLYWGSVQPAAGPLGRKLELLFRHGCSLYASHLPLDAHPEVGNAFELGRWLGMQDLAPFFEYRGSCIGARGEFQKPIAVNFFVERAAAATGAPLPLVLPFGKSAIRTGGIVTGAGGSAMEACSSAGLDILISGEAQQAAYHASSEYGVNAVFMGHYFTETFGVLALKERLAKYFDICSVFIDEPTGI